MSSEGATSNNISGVCEGGLCHGCGTCVGTCPAGAVRLEETRDGVYEPVIDNRLCTHCGLCSKVCPGSSVGFKELNREIFGKRPEDLLVGNYLNVYVGEACDNDTRVRGASGGIATALLLYALERRVIDGALVTVMEGLRPKVILARSAEEVVAASKSKYCPVPVGVGVEEILKREGRYAVVGLPCHIHGFRKAEKVDSRLKDRVAFYLGIFCGHTVTFRGTEFLLEKMRIRPEEVENIVYRTRGWPGGLEVKLKSGEKRFLPHGRYWAPLFGRFFFTPYRCTLCSDNLAELADVAVGDAWLPEYSGESAGKSILLGRSRRGEELLRSAYDDEWICLAKVAMEKVLQSQADAMCFKKQDITMRLRLAKFLGKKSPDYDFRFMQSNLWDLIGALMVYTNLWLSKQRFFCLLLKYIPHKVLMGYGLVVQKIFDHTRSGRGI